MTLAERLAEYVRACFTGLWIEFHEHPDALAEITALCRQEEYADGIEGVLVDTLNDAGERMEGQTVFFDAKEDDRFMKQSRILLKLAQLGRSCLQFLWAVAVCRSVE